MGPINTRRFPGECRMLGCFASSQTHNQLLSCSSPRGRQSVREPEKVTRNLSSSDKSSQIILMGLTSWVTAPLCFLNIGRNFSASSPPPHTPPPAEK